MKAGPLRVGAFKTAPGHEQAVARVQDWTRRRFDLADDATVMVTELACARPGCPPLETVVAFWLADDQRRHFRVFKPTGEVRAERQIEVLRYRVALPSTRRVDARSPPDVTIAGFDPAFKSRWECGSVSAARPPRLRRALLPKADALT